MNGYGTGTVFAMTDSESVGFAVARACFIAAAITFVGFSVYWMGESKLSTLSIIIFGAIIGVISIPCLGLSLLWAKTTEMRVALRLFPDDLPTPRLPMDVKIPDNALRVILGSNVAWATKMPHTILMISGEPLISIDRKGNSDELVVSALKIFDDRKNIIARFSEDGFWVENSTRKKRPDKSTLVVFDHNDQEVLNMHFINKNTIVVTGIFNHSTINRPVIVTQTSMKIGGSTISQSIMGENSPADIFIRGAPVH